MSRECSSGVGIPILVKGRHLSLPNKDNHLDVVIFFLIGNSLYVARFCQRQTHPLCFTKSKDFNTTWTLLKQHKMSKVGQNSLPKKDKKKWMLPPTWKLGGSFPLHYFCVRTQKHEEKKLSTCLCYYSCMWLDAKEPQTRFLKKDFL